jgi:type II secretory pathway pseudopilin PulG
MDLGGQGNRGYAMAALLVAMSVMAVLMGALLPVWTHMATREKEEELIFRGNQYARAIGLFQRKFANTPPPTIDVLVEQRFLRKKYKDPITNEDFQPIYANQAMQQMGGPSGQAGQQSATTSTQPRQVIQAGFGSTGATAAGGIIGVTSKSKESSIKVFNGRQRYNEWAFVHIQTSQRPGQPGGGGTVPGGPAGVPGGPNQRPGGPPGPQPFGTPPGGFPNQRPPGGPGGFQPFQPGVNQPMPMQGVPSRPPMPGSFTSPNGTTFTPIPPGQRPPGQ